MCGYAILGEFGVIYKAFMESKDCAIQEPVAVKTLKGEQHKGKVHAVML